MNKVMQRLDENGNPTGRLRVQLICEDQSKTKTDMAHDLNINTIMAKAALTKTVPVRQDAMKFIDVADVPEYQDALNFITSAKNEFMKLPAQLRKKFGNDPSQLIEFLQNPENHQEAYNLGLVSKPPAPPVVEETPSEPAPAAS